MPARRKIDRERARLEFEAGESFGAIARRQGVSPQAVQKMAVKAGWTRGDGDGALLATTTTARRILSPETPADHRLASEGKRTLPRMREILDAIAEGATRTVAAGLAGVADQTFRDWLADDETFATLIRQAEATKTWRRIGHLEKASARGDVGATRALLERDPASRAEWGAAPSADPAAGPGLVINLHLPGTAAALSGTAHDTITIRTGAPQPAVRLIDHEGEAHGTD